MTGLRPVLATLALLVVAACAVPDRVLLLPGEDGGATGAVAVLDDKGKAQAVVATPYTEAEVGAGTVKQTAVDAARVKQDHGALLGALPLPPKTFVLYFTEGTTNLTTASMSGLEALFAEVAKRPGADVQVTGHTDTKGSSDANDRLSLSRAESIRALLIEKGLDESLVRAAGRGERELLVATGDGVSNAKNRRVAVSVR